MLATCIHLLATLSSFPSLGDYYFKRSSIAIVKMQFPDTCHATFFGDILGWFSSRGGGGGWYLTKFDTERLRPEVQALTLNLYTIMPEKVPLLYRRRIQKQKPTQRRMIF